MIIVLIRSLSYFVLNPNQFRNRREIIFGSLDSGLDKTNSLGSLSIFMHAPKPVWLDFIHLGISLKSKRHGISSGVLQQTFCHHYLSIYSRMLRCSHNMPTLERSDELNHFHLLPAKLSTVQLRYCLFCIPLDGVSYNRYFLLQLVGLF